MDQQLYFVKIGQPNQHRNKLEQRVSNELKRFECVQTTHPDIVGGLVRILVGKCNACFPRCKPVTVAITKCFSTGDDYKITVIGLGGGTVWTAMIYAVRDSLIGETITEVHLPATVIRQQSAIEGGQLSLL